jgi:hypothetical protein
MNTVFLSLLLSVLAVAALGISVAFSARKQADMQERIKANKTVTPTNGRNENRESPDPMELAAIGTGQDTASPGQNARNKASRSGQ